MLEAESVEPDVESVLVVLAVLVEALDVLDVVSPSEESAEAMAAASGLTLFEPDVESEAESKLSDAVLLLEFCPLARDVAQAE